MGRDLLDGVWLLLTELIEYLLTMYRSLNAALVAFEAVSPEAGRILLTTPSPNMKLSILYQASEALSPEGGRIS